MLTVLAHLRAAEVDLIIEAIAFIAACYRPKVKGVTNTHHYYQIQFCPEIEIIASSAISFF